MRWPGKPTSIPPSCTTHNIIHLAWCLVAIHASSVQAVVKIGMISLPVQLGPVSIRCLLECQCWLRCHSQACCCQQSCCLYQLSAGKSRFCRATVHQRSLWAVVLLLTYCLRAETMHFHILFALQRNEWASAAAVGMQSCGHVAAGTSCLSLSEC